MKITMTIKELNTEDDLRTVNELLDRITYLSGAYELAVRGREQSQAIMNDITKIFER